MATSKPEVLTTSAVNKVETRFRRLHLGFRWRLDDWHTTRHRIMHARYQMQHNPSLSYKYFRFWCRDCLITWCILYYFYKSTHNWARETTLTDTNRFYTSHGRTIHWWTTKYTLFRHGDLKTGSSYKLGRERRSDAIPTATRIFMNTPMRLDH